VTKRIFRLFFLSVAGVLLWTSHGLAKSNSDQRLLEVERKIGSGKEKARRLDEQAEQLARDLERIARQRVQAAAEAQDLEAEVTLITARLEELKKQETKQHRLLEARRGQFTKVLAALSNMARNPPEAIIAQPMAPADVVRSAILLRAAVPGIEAQANSLHANLNALAAARTEAEHRRTQLASAVQSLEDKRIDLDGLLVRQKKLKESTEEERKAWAKRIRALTRKAKSLKDLLLKLEAERKKREAKARKRRAEQEARKRRAKKKPGKDAKDQEISKTATVASKAAKGIRSIAKARGRLPYPAVGRLVGRYGENLKNGMTRKGVDIRTLAGARVVAAFSGLVVFSGPFRGYGQLLIIEHGEGYHSLLAGLARIDTVLGESVLAGEPVGVMGSPKRGSPVLYLELRRNGQPINPLPWLTARKGKVNG